MKLLILILLFPFLSIGQSLLKIGDDAFKYWEIYADSMSPKSMKQLGDWNEGQTIFMSFNNGNDTKPYLVVSGEYLIGVLQKGNPDWYYIFDINGDGILDYKTDDYILSYSVIYENSNKKW